MTRSWSRILVVSLTFVAFVFGSLNTATAHGSGYRHWKHHDHGRNQHWRDGGKKHNHWKRHNHRRKWVARGGRHHEWNARPNRDHYYSRTYRYSAPGFFNPAAALGGIAGGVLGNQIGKGRGRTLATVGGVLIGAIIGDNIYREIQMRDQRRISQVLEETPSGRSVSWQNPDTGDQFRVTPEPAYKDTRQRDCRDYKTWVFIDGYEKEIRGTACRTANGQWQIASR
jgi:surface antigen